MCTYMPACFAGNAEAGYSVTLDFFTAMVEAFKAGRMLHKRFAFEIVLQAQRIFKCPLPLTHTCIVLVWSLRPRCRACTLGLLSHSKLELDSAANDRRIEAPVAG